MTPTILLVEDDRGLRRLSERMVARLGYQVLSAGNGEEAITLCREHAGPIALVITDVFMPGIGGPELAKRLLAIRPDLRVLYVSGSTEALDTGALTESSNFLHKPFTADQFTEKILEILKS